MKKIFANIIILMIMLNSTVFAQDIPSNYIVIGDIIVDLTYAMENKEAFNGILIEFLTQGGTVKELYIAIGGLLTDVYGNVKTETQKQEIISSCVILIDKANPDGVPINTENLKVISIY